MGLIPSHLVYRRQPINTSLTPMFLSFYPFFSKKIKINFKNPQMIKKFVQINIPISSYGKIFLMSQMTSMCLYLLNVFQSFLCLILKYLTSIASLLILPFTLGFCNTSHSLFIYYLFDNSTHFLFTDSSSSTTLPNLDVL